MRFFTQNIILINRVIIFLAIFVTLGTLYLTDQFVKDLRAQEKAKMKIVQYLSLGEKKEMQIWANAVSKMASSPLGEEIDPCILDIVKSNNSIPAIWVSSTNEFKDCRNIDPKEFQLKNLTYTIKDITKPQEDRRQALEEFNEITGTSIENFEDEESLVRELEKEYIKAVESIKQNIKQKLQTDQAYLIQTINLMGEINDPIAIELQSAQKDIKGNIIIDNKGKVKTAKTIDYIFYKNSHILESVDKIYEKSFEASNKLKNFPIIILLITISLFLVAYLAFDSSQKAQKNKLWAGIAKETAHQIGTPLSSLMGWIEYLKKQNIKNEIIGEIEKDTNRLQQIAERFSKIGSSPILESIKIIPVLEKTIDYVKKRASKNIDFSFTFEEKLKNKDLNINAELFGWVLENLLKNSIDSVQTSGKIKVSIKQKKNNECIIDVLDNGKGIPSNHFRKIFDPGYTSKQRGWGLGLSLCQRIITQYHKGKIFVFKSDAFKETIVRIIIK